MSQQPKQFLPPQKTVSQVLGEITWLLVKSDTQDLVHLGSRVVVMRCPAEQFGYSRAGPAACGSHSRGSVSDETEQRLINHQMKLSPHEWRSGDNCGDRDGGAIWGQDEMLADAAATIFEGKHLNTK
jgi:cytolysin-activating lysine-acyltransferase